MLTKEYVLAEIRAGRRGPEAVDGRDFARLAGFLETEHWPLLGFSPHAQDVRTTPVREWSEQEFLKQLEDDVAFGFEKALARRGLSADALHACVVLWLWILEDEVLSADPDAAQLYAYYGLPLFRYVALKFGFPNPLGADLGSEKKYEGGYAVAYLDTKPS